MNKSSQLKNRLVVLRAEMGWTQQDLADRVGVSRQTIASLEKNKYNPSLILAFEIAKEFKKDITEVFIYETEEGDN
ncbi:helix-turn-helix transcriptional regulator [Priestia megaterium]|uniref:helix-turn-helix transcriptional regulator n=1 Tax=Priestia megaterium TaxID=1404 RepID=UPI002E1E3421|nr:helix-turn-helix transcriptional regulator [Priestia megaterium]